MFGALAGETALVGGESVYIFERSGGAWSQQAKLLPNDGAGGAFGYSVALAGETALVGAYQDNDQGTSSGSAYVFVRSSGVWSQQAKLLPSDGAASDYFGYSVALAGETALVGAYGDDDQGTDSGSAYVFVRSGGSWSQQAKLLPSDGAAADLLANSVALWGEIALIGAYADDDQGGNSGSPMYSCAAVGPGRSKLSCYLVTGRHMVPLASRSLCQTESHWPDLQIMMLRAQYTSSLSSSISVLPVPRSSRAPAASASMAYAATPLAPATARHARSLRAPLPTALVRL
jgi:hypothetical protein